MIRIIQSQHLQKMGIQHIRLKGRGITLKRPGMVPDLDVYQIAPDTVLVHPIVYRSLEEYYRVFSTESKSNQL